MGCRLSPSLLVRHDVGDGRDGNDKLEIKLPFESLCDDLKVEHAEEAAAEATPEHAGGLLLER